MPVANAMKLLFCSDLHGDAPNYARLQTAAAELRPDLIILGGDMLPDDTAGGRGSYLRARGSGPAAA